jgi:hypothetical protein
LRGHSSVERVGGGGDAREGAHGYGGVADEAPDGVPHRVGGPPERSFLEDHGRREGESTAGSGVVERGFQGEGKFLRVWHED